MAVTAEAMAKWLPLALSCSAEHLRIISAAKLISLQPTLLGLGCTNINHSSSMDNSQQELMPAECHQR